VKYVVIVCILVAVAGVGIGWWMRHDDDELD
jgi:hypothetical protein